MIKLYCFEDFNEGIKLTSFPSKESEKDSSVWNALYFPFSNNLLELLLRLFENKTAYRMNV
jgi:hypothetical protein